MDTDADRLVEECARARSAHAEAIHALLTALLQPMAPAELERRHAALQRAQLTSTGRLRGRLRDVLARTSEQGARLAEIDAVMEQVLAPREYRLLNRLPAHLAACLPIAASADAVTANPDATSPDVMPAPLPEPSWPPALRDTVRDLLLAELDLRFHPIDGLSAAVHPHRAPPHAA